MQICAPTGTALCQAQGFHPGLRQFQGMAFPGGIFCQQPQAGRVPVLFAPEIPLFNAQYAHVVLWRRGQTGRDFLMAQFHRRYSGPKL